MILRCRSLEYVAPKFITNGAKECGLKNKPKNFKEESHPFSRTKNIPESSPIIPPQNFRAVSRYFAVKK